MNNCEQTRLTPQRYHELLAGLLTHRACALRISLLQQALYYVARATGTQGAHALESWCRLMSEQEAAEEVDREYR